MLIDWFTIVAQIINFLILVFLLHRFLYKPIVKTIKSRQNEIERRWQDAEDEKESAKQTANSYKQKQRELEQKEQDIIAQAQEEADHKYHNLVEQARQEVEQKRQSWEESLQQDKEQFYSHLREKITQQVYEISRHAFEDLANISLEKQVINRFLHRLENLSEKERHHLAACLQKNDNGLVIRSHFEIPSENRDQILNSLHRTQIYQGENVHFTETSDLICGIELQASDYKIAWNLKDYLQNLEIEF